jgi:hypothetical protein
MPIGPASLQSYQASVYTSDTADLYKAKLDANSAIASNVAGIGYVYPTNPASLTVQVDLSYNIPQISHGYQLQGTNAPATVALTAPSSAFYYGTVYLDTLTNALGVVYSPLSAAAPIQSDYVHQIALAGVYLATGQTTISAANIIDLRSPLFRHLTLTVYAGTIPNPYHLDCRQADRINLWAHFGGSCSAYFDNLRIGSHVQASWGNISGGTVTLGVGATTPSGTAYQVYCMAVTSGGGLGGGGTTAYVDMGVTGMTFGGGIQSQWNGFAAIQGSTPTLLFMGV